MHHQHRLSLSLLQWNPEPARRNPTTTTCGLLHAVIVQEASDHVPHITDQFIAHIGDTDLAVLLNKDTVEPDPMVFAFREDSTSKGTWGMVYSSFEACWDAFLFLAHRLSHFVCSVHIHNVVAKNVMHPLIFYDCYMATRSSPTSTSLGATST